ncbi:MAG: hypothetical protein SZ59_C0001G0122 [candidate division TM6 bacterium GW2011_GWF2_28_16]|nr:MAG: hypothetical protein SZ59_C0001G0122 [candidate division TM6 bacterium GW2011_GWF2_28_16]
MHLKFINTKKITLFLLIISFIKNINSHVFLVNKKPQEIMIKVLLNKLSSTPKTILSLKSKNGLFIDTKDNNKKLFISEPFMELMVKDGQLFIAAKNHITNKITSKKIESNKIEINAVNGNIEYNKINYSGKLVFLIDKTDKEKNLLIISKLSLDAYVYSVVGSEIYPTWPFEMQKVQAIISRTYAINLINENNNKKQKQLYHIKNNNFHQKYNGEHNYKRLKQAVIETKGEIITYKNKPILAMFDACCGGIDTSKMSALNYKAAPYLSRKTPCNYCKNYELYRWQVNYPVQNFIDKLKKNLDIAKKLVGTKKLLDIKIMKQDKAGIVKRIKLIFSNKEITLNASQFWENLKENVRSLNFTIKKINNKIIINGKGYGHQTGLCQRGAYELVNRGWDYKSIIKFYYPGVDFAVLQYAKA